MDKCDRQRRMQSNNEETTADPGVQQSGLCCSNFPAHSQWLLARRPQRKHSLKSNRFSDSKMDDSCVFLLVAGKESIKMTCFSTQPQLVTFGNLRVYFHTCFSGYLCTHLFVSHHRIYTSIIIEHMRCPTIISTYPRTSPLT